MRLMNKGIMLVLLLAVAACGPVYTTEYEMIPPNTQEGRFCANNCLMAQNNCSQSCSLESQRCELDDRRHAEREYDEYVRKREKEGKEIKRSVSSFENSYRCDNDDCEERCGGNYRICHTNCGGQVIPRTYCSAFCEQ